MQSVDCLRLVHVRLVKLCVFVILLMETVEHLHAYVSNTKKLTDHQLIAEFVVGIHSSVPSWEYLQLIESQTTSVVCRDNANISFELGVSLRNTTTTRPFIIIPAEQIGGVLATFPNVQSYFVLIRASPVDKLNSRNFYKPSLVYIRSALEKDGEIVPVLEWESLEMCKDRNELSFATILVNLPDYEEYLEFLWILSALEYSVKSQLPSGNLQTKGAETNTSRTDEAGDLLKAQLDKRNTDNSHSREKGKKKWFRKLILPRSQHIYTTFRYSRDSPKHAEGEPVSTDKPAESAYILELQAVAFHFITGFGRNCSSGGHKKLTVSLSSASEQQDEKTYQEIVDHYLTLLDVECYPSLVNSTMRLFRNGILVPSRGWKVTMNRTHNIMTQRILSPTEFEDILSAFYFASFSTSYLTLINDKSLITSNPSGKLISSSSRLITHFTLNLLQLFSATSKYFIEFHLVKTISRLIQTLEYFYLTLITQGNQLVCQDHEESSTSPCQALSKIKFNNLMQIAGLIHFLIHNLPAFISFQNDLDYNSLYSQHFRHHRDEILNFVRKPIKNKSIK